MTILLIIPAFIALNSINYSVFILGLLILPILTGGLCAPAYPYAIKKFAAEVRYSGVGLSYTLGIAIFGGFSSSDGDIKNKNIKFFNGQLRSLRIRHNVKN